MQPSVCVLVTCSTMWYIADEETYETLIYVVTHTISAAAHLTFCALFDKSTKFGTDVDQYVINIFGYGGDQKMQLRLP